MGSQGQYRKVTSRVGLGMLARTSTLPLHYNPGIHDMKERAGWGKFLGLQWRYLADDASHCLDIGPHGARGSRGQSQVCSTDGAENRCLGLGRRVNP